MNSTEHYNSLDGLRAYSAICILVMHIFANSEYVIPILTTSELMPFLNNLTFLFMMVSGFSMCCGYYDRIVSGKITLSSFYKKRYQKVWPYFTVLVLLDFAVSPSLHALYETFADLTLCFGFLPNANISVIGVGWFLGVVFAFYLLFPFFCFLLENRKRAWLAMLTAVTYNVLCSTYFLIADHVVENFYARTSFVFCFMFFMAGGLIYLYREELYNAAHDYKWIFIIAAIAGTIAYLLIPSLRTSVTMYLTLLGLFTIWLIYAISTEGKILNNKPAMFLSGISMEIYLCHMVVFRVVEKLHLNYLFGSGWFSYIVTTGLVVAGAIVFSICVKFGLARIQKLICKINTESYKDRRYHA